MLPEWVKRPDVIFSTVISIIGVVVSLYAHEIEGRSAGRGSALLSRICFIWRTSFAGYNNCTRARIIYYYGLPGAYVNL